MAVNRTTLRLCIAEQQEIFRRLYEVALAPQFDVEMLACPLDQATLPQAVSKSNPDVLMVGARNLDEQISEAVAEIRIKQHQMGMVILVMHYTQQDTELMRRLATGGSGGIALFLKQSIVQAEQLIHMVSAVRLGQVILDPALSVAMLTAQCSLLRQMTNREREILALLANGYTNAGIARALMLDVKTVEHYINSMYSKLKSMTDFEDKHPRVEAARLYLQATGELPDRDKKR